MSIKINHMEMEKPAMTFAISEVENEKLKEWKEKIKDLYGEYGTYTYSFTPTGIGSSIRVKSHLTGLELDITDLDSW
jgi:hypothetical protein